MFRVVYSKDAIKALRRMPANTADNVRGRIADLATDSDAPNANVSRLKGRPERRLRVGDWRVLFAIDRKAQVIQIRVIAPRGSVYR